MISWFQDMLMVKPRLPHLLMLRMLLFVAVLDAATVGSTGNLPKFSTAGFERLWTLRSRNLGRKLQPRSGRRKWVSEKIGTWSIKIPDSIITRWIIGIERVKLLYWSSNSRRIDDDNKFEVWSQYQNNTYSSEPTQPHNHTYLYPE